MRRLVAYWTSQCDRCNAKESVPAQVCSGSVSGKVLTAAELPPDWDRIAGGDFCPDCARIIREVLTRVAPRPLA